LAGFSVITIGILACGSAGGATDVYQVAPTLDTAQEKETRTVYVSMKAAQFNPERISVPVGTTIVWTNDESIPHTVTAGDESWDSGVLQEGASYTLTFDTPGNYCYYCVLHPGHAGEPCSGSGVMYPLQADLVSLGGGGVPMQGTIVVME
jgi:plastocyanin